ncbi:MAG TPA: nitroreductase family protein [Thermodesulfobacteriota bacterium]|nr:nitroreductase family protein [Thermodesulfobacteriota bacterium]
MDVFECVSTLSSIRSYKRKPVPESIVREVIEAGRLAPSAHNDQPWQFILVRDNAKLEGLEKYCISGRFVSEVDFAVVVVTDPSSKWHETDGTRAVQNMVLTAWNHNLGSCWIGNIDRAGLKKYLNIPDGLHVLTVLPFGYFDQRQVSPAKNRKSPEQVFHLDTFGNRAIK